MPLSPVSDTQTLRDQIHAWRKAGKTIGFVPTMGNLHAGHLSLVAHAAEHADKVVVSIFVNPMQFAPGEDFETYPRTLDDDLAQLEAQGITALVYAPRVQDLYPIPLTEQTVVSVPKLSEGLCAITRPHFFNGVSTVVAKLFNLVQPDCAVFGKKDRQQLYVIQKMVQDLCLPIKIIPGDIVRESDGLAMSSRNRYLSATERLLAPKLHETLKEIKMNIEMSGPRGQAAGRWDGHAAGYCEAAITHLKDLGFDVHYLELRDAENLSLTTTCNNDMIVFVAATLGKTRLIDNLDIQCT